MLAWGLAQHKNRNHLRHIWSRRTRVNHAKRAPFMLDLSLVSEVIVLHFCACLLRWVPFKAENIFRPIILPIQDVCKTIAFIYNVSALSSTELAHAGTFLFSTLSISSW